jgi:hypothetical protein
LPDTLSHQGVHSDFRIKLKQVHGYFNCTNRAKPLRLRLLFGFSCGGPILQYGPIIFSRRGTKQKKNGPISIVIGAGSGK